MNALAILNAISLAFAVAKELPPLVESTKRWLDDLFSQGVISKAEQDLLKAHCDSHMQARLRGERPPEMAIDPS